MIYSNTESKKSINQEFYNQQTGLQIWRRDKDFAEQQQKNANRVHHHQTLKRNSKGGFWVEVKGY